MVCLVESFNWSVVNEYDTKSRAGGGAGRREMVEVAVVMIFTD